LLSHTKTVSHSRLQVQGLHLSRACPVFHSCQPNHHRLNPFPLRRTSWYCCLPLTPAGIHMLSHHSFVGRSFLLVLAFTWLVLSVLPTPTDSHHSQVDLLPRTPSVNSYRSSSCTAIHSFHVACRPLDWTPWTLVQSICSAVVPQLLTWLLVDSDSHGLSVHLYL
jgi:hypothetical protein